MKSFEALSQSLIVDPSSTISFEVKNAGINVDGYFSNVKCDIIFFERDLLNSRINAEIDVKTLSTGISMRDKHLLGNDYFDVKDFPHIKFSSVKILPGNLSGQIKLIGNLTIKGITREIQMPVTYKETSSGYVFESILNINRLNFTVGKSSWTMADEVEVTIKIMTKK